MVIKDMKMGFFSLCAHDLSVGDLALLGEELSEAILIDVLGQILYAETRPVSQREHKTQLALDEKGRGDSSNTN